MALLKPRYNKANFFLITMYLFFPLAPSTFGEDDDAAYMTELAKALTPTPPGWSPDVHFCKWRAIKCDGSNRVTGISLFSLPLTGTIPAGLNSLSQLTTLGLAYSSLSGPLPSLENLSMLTYAIFENSSFTSIPNGCFKGLTSLLVLTLSNNINLAPWTFPADLAQSTGLVTLKLDTTNMIGSLPNIFDSLGRLDYLSLSNNSISGDLPKSFADSGISHLFLDNQKDGLSGTIDVLSSMTELSQVWLQNNQFTGPIPDLSNCTNLFDLQLQDNKLTGVIPYSLMHHSSLQNISLDNNYFQGPRPLFDTAVKVTLNGINTFCIETPGPCDPRVTTLLEIAAAFGYPIRLANSWLGNNPCKNWNFIICQEEKIVTVNLGKLNLTGTISPAFANLTDLINLDLSVNNLIGPIPVRLTSLQQLETLNLSYNSLSGPLPRFAARVKLDIAGNVLLLGRNGTEGNVTPNQNYSKTAKGSSVLRWIAGALAASVGLVILIVIIFKRKRCISLVQSRILKKPCSSHDINVENFIKNHSFLAPKRYSFSEVKRITNSFQNKLGQGGFGVVYKGSLHDGRHVAVKVLSEVTGSGDEFINEVASISKTSHVNIVSLLGFCYERNNRALIYEFMANGSLDKFIYKKGSPNAICNLDWSILYEIAIGIARGLEYLHRGCSTRILHFDIKPQNILLDEDFCPKISDFGLAKLCKKKESIVSILGTRGTVGYIAPEVFSRAFGRVSHKSDVFSYGMLIIEMIGGRKNYASGGSHSSEMFFPDWIYKDIEQGNIPKNCLVNSREENDMVMKMTLLSLWCIQTQPSDRPSMSKVVDMFEGPLQAVPSPPKPVLYYPKRETVPISDISSSNIHVTNSITIQQDVPSNQILSSTKT